MWRRLEPMARHTTFRIGGPASWYAEPCSIPECVKAWRQAQNLGLPVHVLGGGSNLLIDSRPLRAAVISLRHMEPRAIAVRRGLITASAGVPLPRMVQWTVRAGYTGLEFLAGVPGLVGGAARMNAGSPQLGIGAFIASLTCLDAAGRVVTRPASRVTWAYRHCGLRDPLILAVQFRLRRHTPKACAELARQALRKKSASQPLGAWSAGCFFRNPPNASAGQLIDTAGLKGARVGGALVSPVHANFIVNAGGATSDDVLGLARRVRKEVRARFGVALDPEIRLWPGATLSEGE